MSTIDPQNLSNEIERALREYADVTEKAAQNGVVETANNCVDRLRVANPSGSGKWGSWERYNNSWTSKSYKFNDSYVEVVHNQKHYRLTHLLENGHALHQGGRAGAFPHIAPVAEMAEKELLSNIKKNIV